MSVILRRIIFLAKPHILLFKAAETRRSQGCPPPFPSLPLIYKMHVGDEKNSRKFRNLGRDSVPSYSSNSFTICINGTHITHSRRALHGPHVRTFLTRNRRSKACVMYIQREPDVSLPFSLQRSIERKKGKIRRQAHLCLVRSGPGCWMYTSGPFMFASRCRLSASGSRNSWFAI